MVSVEAAANADEIDVDDLFDEATGIRYIGKARRQFDGTWRCAAVIGGQSLCLVEIRVHPVVRVDHDPGDEDQPRRSP